VAAWQLIVLAVILPLAVVGVFTVLGFVLIRTGLARKVLPDG